MNKKDEFMPFDQFLSEMLMVDNMSLESLIEIVGRERAYQILEFAEQLKKSKLIQQEDYEEEQTAKAKDSKKTKKTTIQKTISTKTKKLTSAKKDIGRETANRILDNSNNWIGAPALGPSTAVILHGQLHKFAGSINDVKASVGEAMDKKKQTKGKTSPEEPARPSTTPRFK